MKKIKIFDIDDTLFFANQMIGMEVEGVFRWITQQEFHEHDVAGTVHSNLDFQNLNNSIDFLENLQPNMIAIERLQKDIDQNDSRIVVMTARHPMNDIPLFKTAFHQYGIDTDKVELIFAGIAGEPHWSSHKKKAVFFEEFLQENYDEIEIIDDNTSNLKELHYLALDYPFTHIKSYHVKPDGTINKYCTKWGR